MWYFDALNVGGKEEGLSSDTSLVVFRINASATAAVVSLEVMRSSELC